jgi:squalene synthase HpnC
MNGTAENSDQVLETGWAALPAIYSMPAQTPTLAEAQQYCRELTQSHYENFHVASWFLPKRLRPHFESIYAYCRISDDLGDEVETPEQALALLDYWGIQLDDCYRGVVTHPVFVALAETIRACDIPQEPFADLLVAFRQDQTVSRYETRADILDYCRYSANPVGRLVLYACGYRDAERFRLSDATCTALQLANFWQDVRVDWQKGRVYIPGEDMRRFAIDEQVIASGETTEAFRALMREEVSWAHALFAEGMPLIHRVDKELALDLDLFSRGGLAILSAIEQQNYDVLRARPSISKMRKAALLLRALAAKFIPGFAVGGKAA